jgi:hypothetical protein
MKAINSIKPLKITKINFINQNIDQKVVDNNLFVTINIRNIENTIKEG